MAQSKINELEFLGREGNQLSSTPVSGKRKPCLLLPLKKKGKILLFLFHPTAFLLSPYLGEL